MTQLDFWSEELPANHSALQDYAKDLTIQEATLLSPMLEFLTSLDPSGAYGKMCQVSSVLGGGRDFGSFLGALGEIGYGWAYRVLDAQYFGVAQRRKRVFVIGYLGDWKPAAEILFESESLRGDIKKGRGEGKDIANCLTKSPSSHSSFNPARGEGNGVVVKWPADTASTLNASFGEKLGLENQHINSGAPLFVQAVYENHALDSRIKEVDISPAIRAAWGTGGGNVPYVQFVDTYNGTIQGDVSATMTADMAGPTHSGPKVMQNMAVRRLTPVECERLQGFPDNYTNIPKAADGNRYKALGNSMAVPVMRWIGERINQYEQRGMEKHL